jgi:hypothetical protein
MLKRRISSLTEGIWSVCSWEFSKNQWRTNSLLSSLTAALLPIARRLLGPVFLAVAPTGGGGLQQSDRQVTAEQK